MLYATNDAIMYLRKENTGHRYTHVRRENKTAKALPILKFRELNFSVEVLVVVATSVMTVWSVSPIDHQSSTNHQLKLNEDRA